LTDHKHTLAYKATNTFTCGVRRKPD